MSIKLSLIINEYNNRNNHNHNNLIDSLSFISIFLCSFTKTNNYRKARRKEKDGDQNSNDTKLYLEESVLERKLTDANLNTIVELPAGLDYNEWLASHSTYTPNTLSFHFVEN